MAPQPAAPAQDTEDPTVGDYLSSQHENSLPKATSSAAKASPATAKAAQAAQLLYSTKAYVSWSAAQQKEFFKLLESFKVPIPVPIPSPESLGYNGYERPASAWRGRGRRIWDLKMSEYQEWKDGEEELRELRRKSEVFRENHRRNQGVNVVFDEREVQEEKGRRRRIAQLEGKREVGVYEGDPLWDDMVPIPQDDGEGALAAIAYADEYREAMSYLRAVMANYEHSPRIFPLTQHIIEMNPAHYTVWLYRASTLFAVYTPSTDPSDPAPSESLTEPIYAEIDWTNSVALENEKNYQIWHHRHLLLDALYPFLSSGTSSSLSSSIPDSILTFANSERRFMAQMFARDSKNYHVWSYRSYLVRKLNLFSDPAELTDTENFITDDVRNNSAWNHRFFVVFENPKWKTEEGKGELKEVVEREVEWTRERIMWAPQNASPWNYLRGVLRKAGESVGKLEGFARELVKGGPGEEEVVKSSFALELLADVWAEKGEIEKADWALMLLGEKYDPVRKNYWDFRRAEIKSAKA